MHTKILMNASAAFMLILGLGLTFAPQELLRQIDGGSHPVIVPILQTTGALYLGFAILNWIAKDNLIGGIYSRPVAMGNFLQFFAGTMALVKAVSARTGGGGFIVIALLYAIFAVWFGLVLFGSPVRSTT